MKLLILITIQLFLRCQAGEERTPHWENLECEPGHKYLFSEVTMTWEEARVECDLSGGWLVDINRLEEQNCLLRQGNSQGYDTWYHTDGKIIYFWFTDFEFSTPHLCLCLQLMILNLKEFGCMLLLARTWLG